LVVIAALRLVEKEVNSFVPTMATIEARVV